MTRSRPVAFGPFEIDPVSLELRREGVCLPLEPLPARILLRLAEDAGAMVSRRELRELGWPKLPGAAEQSLNTCVYQIRRALDASGPHGVSLDTLRGRGYRLSAPAPAPGLADRPGGMRPRRLRSAAALAAGIALATAGILALAGSPAATPPEAARALERARYLAERTNDRPAARAVLDSARLRFAEVAAVQAAWAESRFWAGEVDAATRAATRAVELDGSSVTGLRTLAMLALLRGDGERADVLLGRALELDREDPRTLVQLAWRRTAEGRFEDAARHVARAQEVDPLATTLHQDAGLLHLLAGRYAQAEASCREVLRFEPRSAWAADCLFDVMVLTGDADGAGRWGRRLVELQGGGAPDADLPPAEVVAAVEAWRLDAWQGAVGRGAYPLGLAFAYAANGRADDALEALRAAARRPRPGLLTVAVDPRLALLHGRPEFDALVRGLWGSGPSGERPS